MGENVRFKQLVGQSYNLRNFQYDCQRTVNWYPEVDETGAGKESEVAQLVPRPGLRASATNVAAGSRGGYVASNGTAYWMMGPTLYTLSITPGVSTSLTGTPFAYTFANNGFPCFFTDNGTDLFITSAGNNYSVNLSSGTIAQLTGGAFGSASSNTFLDGYIVYSKLDTNQFFWTNLYSTVADGLNFASAESNPDKLVGLVNNNLDLWLFGKKTIELWYNYGSNNVVFQRRPNTLLETGCTAPYTIQKLNNTLFWLSQDDRGGPMFMMANGYTPQRMSTFAIEQQWQKFTSQQLAGANGFTYQEGGHHFYVLNIPGADTTWVFDMTVSLQLGTPTWHERRSFNGDGDMIRWVAYGHVYLNGFHITADYNSGKLYVMDNDYRYDDTQPIVLERTSPHVTNSMDRIRYSNLTCDFFTGNVIDPELDPQVMLQWSDDGGATWTDEMWVSCGKIGEYGLKVQFQRLGMGRSRVFRIRCSDPIYWCLSGASIDMQGALH